MVFTMNTTIDLSSGEQGTNEHDDDDNFEMDFGGDLDLGNEFDSIMNDVGNTNLEAGTDSAGSIRTGFRGTIDMTPFDQPGGEKIIEILEFDFFQNLFKTNH